MPTALRQELNRRRWIIAVERAFRNEPAGPRRDTLRVLLVELCTHGLEDVQ